MRMQGRLVHRRIALVKGGDINLGTNELIGYYRRDCVRKRQSLFERRRENEKITLLQAVDINGGRATRLLPGYHSCRHSSR